MIELIAASIGFFILAEAVIYQLNSFQNGLFLGFIDPDRVFPSSYQNLGYNLLHP
jgi:hypothetical protein